MINTSTLVGRLTRDPELRRTANGVAVTSFTLALNRSFTSSDGQQADYIPCVVWDKVAENVEKYCSKGSLVGVDGRLQSRTYDNAQGQKVYVVEVVCRSVQFLETKAVKEYRGVAEAKQDRTGEFYDMNTVDLEKEFDNSTNSFDIQEEDIQF